MGANPFVLQTERLKAIPERFIGFPSHIGHPREAADGPALREVPADAPRDGLQPLRLKHKGVCPHQKDPLDELSPEQLLGLGQIRLNVLQGREPEAEGQLVVKRAELAAVVGAAGGRLQQQGAGFIGRTPDGACVVHGSLPPCGLSRSA